MSLFPTKSQAATIKANGLHPFAYVVLDESEAGLIVRHLISHAVRYLAKEATDAA